MKKTKKLLLLVVSCMMAVAVQAQDCVMPIAVALKSATAQPLPIAQQRVVANKLRQLLSATSGATGTVGFHSFALVPDYEVLNKSVTPGPPRKTVYQLQLSMQVLNTADGVVFEAYTTQLDGVGNSEYQAFSDAVKRLAPKNKDIISFMTRAQRKMIDYYNNNAERMLTKARALEQTRQYDEALSQLCIIPSCCNGYDEAQQLIVDIWQKRVNLEGQRILQKAKAIWAAGQDMESAQRAAMLLTEIDPESSSIPAATELLSEIKQKVGEENEWARELEMKKYNDTLDMDQRRLDAAREVAIAFAENQKEEQTPNLVFVEQGE